MAGPPSSDYVQIHRPVDPGSEFPFHYDAANTTPWKKATAEARIITFFQQKGGVGKTTCSYTVAYALARSGHHVLYVDADNQCNGLQAALAKHVYHKHGGDWDRFFAVTQFEDTLLTTLRQGLHPPAYDMRPPAVAELKLRILEGCDPPPFCNCKEATWPELVDVAKADLPGKGRFFIMRGDTEITEWDTQMAQSLALMNMSGMAVTKEVPGMFYHACQMTAHHYGAQYVIVDLSPSSALFNRFAVLSSHGLIIPMGVDSANREAVRSLGATQLARWYQQYHATFIQSSGPTVKYPLPPSGNGAVPRVTRFLGAVFSRVGQAGAVRPTNHFMMLRKIFEDITDKLLPSLAQHGMLLPSPIPQHAADAAHGIAVSGPTLAGKGLPIIPAGVIATFPEFHQLALIGQRECIPVPYTQCHHYKHVRESVLTTYQQACADAAANNQPPPAAPADWKFFKLYAANLRKKLGLKAAAIRIQLDVVLELIMHHT